MICYQDDDSQRRRHDWPTDRPALLVSTTTSVVMTHQSWPRNLTSSLNNDMTFLSRYCYINACLPHLNSKLGWDSISTIFSSFHQSNIKGLGFQPFASFLYSFPLRSIIFPFTKMSFSISQSQGFLGYSLATAIFVVGVVVVLGSLYILYVREGTPLRSIPGPFFASITKLWIFQQQRGYQRHRVDIDLHRKYGPIVRIAPSEVLVSSPQSLKTIYGMSTFLNLWGSDLWDGSCQNGRLAKLH